MKNLNKIWQIVCTVCKSVWKFLCNAFNSICGTFGISTTKEKVYIIVIVVLVALSAFLVHKQFTHKTTTKTDTTNVFHDSKDTAYVSTDTDIKTISELKKQYSDLYEEYKRLKDNNPVVISKTETTTEIKNLKIPTTIEKYPGAYNFRWNYSERTDDNNNFSIYGHTKADSLLTNASTIIDTMSLKSSVWLDVIDNPDDNTHTTLKIIARSGNPRMSISSVSGAVINPKKNKAISSKFPTKHWGLGVHAGYGLGIPLSGGNATVSPYIGVGISYNILNW